MGKKGDLQKRETFKKENAQKRDIQERHTLGDIDYVQTDFKTDRLQGDRRGEHPDAAL